MRWAECGRRPLWEAQRGRERVTHWSGARGHRLDCPACPGWQRHLTHCFQGASVGQHPLRPLCWGYHDLGPFHCLPLLAKPVWSCIHLQRMGLGRATGGQALTLAQGGGLCRPGGQVSAPSQVPGAFTVHHGWGASRIGPGGTAVHPVSPSPSRCSRGSETHISQSSPCPMHCPSWAVRSCCWHLVPKLSRIYNSLPWPQCQPGSRRGVGGKPSALPALTSPASLHPMELCTTSGPGRQSRPPPGHCATNSQELGVDE